MKENKSERVVYRASKEQLKKIDTISEKQNVDRSKVLRELVDKRYEQIKREKK